MNQFINGQLFRALTDYAIRNLALHCEEINDLNVFPVPDGDTGTNMLTTARIGYAAIENFDGSLSETAKKFSGAIVYGARGNSGVILSQFLKGFSQVFADTNADEADCDCFIRALSNGVDFAYNSVSHPAEGTILTVLREATEEVTGKIYDDLAVLLTDFLARAEISLQNTPNLLPVLKSAGVVDSGGVGAICFFDGMRKYLCGEELSIKVPDKKETVVDYSEFDCNTVFEYGYCTEALLQLCSGREQPDCDSFRAMLNELGESVVTSFEDDKIKFHVHTRFPEKVLAYAHGFGEFLSLKIENMSVQHSGQADKTVTVSAEREKGAFALVVVAPNGQMAELFMQMGADVVISAYDGYSPSTQDFIKAYSAAECENVIVLPNDKNLFLVAEQAQMLSENMNVYIADTKSIAACYASLAIVDFDCGDPAQVTADINRTVGNIYDVVITRSAKDTVFDSLEIKKDDFIAMAGSSILAVGKSVIEVACAVADSVLGEQERDTVTFFAGSSFGEDDADELSRYITKNHIFTETDLVTTGIASFDLILSFE